MVGTYDENGTWKGTKDHTDCKAEENKENHLPDK